MLTLPLEHFSIIQEVRANEGILKAFCAALPEDRKLKGNDFDMVGEIFRCLLWMRRDCINSWLLALNFRVDVRLENRALNDR